MTNLNRTLQEQIKSIKSKYTEPICNDKENEEINQNNIQEQNENNCKK